MIHQMIFAAPRPGMTVQEFHRYWLEVHAVQYASKITQITRYKVDTTIEFGRPEGAPPWKGVAEIWIRAEDQLKSMQSEEFLQGARLDEPRWAAFWSTVAMDTDAHVLLEPPVLEADDSSSVKIIRLVKRREGVSLKDFRDRSLGSYAALAGKVPGLRGYLQNHAVDGMYAVGEAVLDGAHQLWFDNVDDLSAALASPEFRAAEDELSSFVEARYLHELVVREHWIIGPEYR